MRKYYPLLSILFIVFCLSIKPASASHWAGGSIVWECISPSQYRITAILYRDCSGITAPTTVSVGYTNQGTGCTLPSQPPNTGNLQLALIPEFDREIYTPCEITPSRCKGGTRFGLEKYKYTAIFNVPTLPVGASPACFDWTWSFSQCCRNNADNMTGQPNFFIDSRFSSIQVPCDNGPIVELNSLPQQIGQQDNTDLGVSYLTNILTEEKWKTTLKARIKKEEKNNNIYHILYMFVHVINDLFRNLILDKNTDNFFDNGDKIIKYSNEQIERINKRYKSKETKYFIRV
jgi:hypothetical protein